MTQTHIELQNEAGQPIAGEIEYLENGGVISFSQIPIGGIDLGSPPSGTNSFRVSADGYYSFTTSVLSDDNLFVLVKKENSYKYALIGAGVLGGVWLLSRLKK